MSDDPKKLQEMETGDPTTLEWSTVSNIHAKDAELLKSEDLVKRLQTLNANQGPVTLDWSTVSNVHT
jgi:hypothetical protein